MLACLKTATVGITGSNALRGAYKTIEVIVASAQVPMTLEACPFRDE